MRGQGGSCPANLLRKVDTMNKTEKKPKLELIGADGNAFAILGKAQRVAKGNGLDWDAIQAEAMIGDYDHLLRTMMTHFEVI